MPQYSTASTVQHRHFWMPAAIPARPLRLFADVLAPSTVTDCSSHVDRVWKPFSRLDCWDLAWPCCTFVSALACTVPHEQDEGPMLGVCVTGLLREPQAVHAHNSCERSMPAAKAFDDMYRFVDVTGQERFQKHFKVQLVARCDDVLAH